MVTETPPRPAASRLVRITTALTCAFVLSGLLVGYASPQPAGATVKPRERLLTLINEVRERRGVRHLHELLVRLPDRSAAGDVLPPIVVAIVDARRRNLSRAGHLLAVASGQAGRPTG